MGFGKIGKNLGGFRVYGVGLGYMGFFCLVGFSGWVVGVWVENVWLYYSFIVCRFLYGIFSKCWSLKEILVVLDWRTLEL